VVRAERGCRVVQHRPGFLFGDAPLVVRVEEPVHQELELEVLEAVLVHDRPHVLERAGLEHMREVCVPEPDPAEADALGLSAPVGEVEQAPLPADVHLDRPGGRPVEPNEVDAGHRGNANACVLPAPLEQRSCAD